MRIQYGSSDRIEMGKRAKMRVNLGYCTVPRQPIYDCSHTQKSVKRFFIILFCVQGLSAQSKPEPDVSGCIDSKNLPKLLTCRVDNCEQKDSDHREVPVREDASGQPVLATLDGESRSVMYECAAAMTPATIVQQAAAGLRAARFQVPYQFAEREGAVTAARPPATRRTRSTAACRRSPRCLPR